MRRPVKTTCCPVLIAHSMKKMASCSDLENFELCGNAGFIGQIQEEE